MASTPVALRTAQPRVMLSPVSGHQKRIHKRLSGVSLMQQSPDLPDVVLEEDSQTSRQRRHSRGFSKVLHLSKNATAADLAEQRPKVSWTKDQLLQHYSQCMKLSQENKINHKNAFELQLIEHMNEVIRQDGSLNFRLAGGTIFAGAKIYASRVDAVHSEIYRVLSSLGGDEDKNTGEQVDDENQLEPKIKKRKKNSKILETNPATLRLMLINACWPSDLSVRSRTVAIDAASCESLNLNQTEVDLHETTLLFDEECRPTEIEGASLQEDSKLLFDIPEKCLADCFEDATSGKTVCDSLRELDFGANPIDSITSDMSQNVQSQGSQSQSQGSLGDVASQNCLADNDMDDFDAAAPADDDEPSVFVTQEGQNSGAKGDSVENDHDVLDPGQLVSVLPQEYSYFKPSALNVYNGPEHWHRHKSAKSASSVIAEHGDDETTSEKSSVAKRRRKSKSNVDLTSDRVKRDRKLQPQKISKAKLEVLKANRRLNLLLQTTVAQCESILAATQIKVVVKPLTQKMISKAGVSVYDPDGVIDKFNYENNEFCPAIVDSDYDDDPIENDDGEPGDAPLGFPNSVYNASETFLPDFGGGAPEPNQDSNPALSTHSDYNNLFEGDHLINEPRKVAKIEVGFATRAKRIDVRKLKSAMWSILKTPEKDKTREVETPQKITNDNHDPAENETEKPDEPQAATEATATPEVDKEGETPADVAASEGHVMFSDLYKKLPFNMPHDLSENLSVPLAFTCLLHLANEKHLKIEDVPSLNNLKISQG